jgi:hypothetical protein
MVHEIPLILQTTHTMRDQSRLFPRIPSIAAILDIRGDRCEAA